MKNVLVGIFSIPLAIMLAFGFVLATAGPSHYGLGGISVLAIMLVVFRLACVGVNVYAVKTSHAYKKSSVASLALYLPLASAILSAAAVFYGLYMASVIFWH
jgi:hypothetical protein